MNLTVVPTSSPEGAFLSFRSGESNAVIRDDSAVARKRDTNVLLIGVNSSNRDGAEASVLLQEPVMRWEPCNRLILPSPDSTGSQVLHEVGLLPHADQLRLLEWLERSNGRSRVVCTSSGSLFELVQAGQFVEKLFYRLNTVTQVIK